MHLQAVGELCVGGVPAHLLRHDPLGVLHAPDLLGDVDRDADHGPLVVQGPAHSPDNERPGVGREAGPVPGDPLPGGLEQRL
ncbi:MAG: hypothetical protein ACK55Z_13570, partial [bacterium]